MSDRTVLVVSGLAIGIPVTAAVLKHAGVPSLLVVVLICVLGGIFSLASIAVRFAMLNKTKFKSGGLDDQT